MDHGSSLALIIYDVEQRTRGLSYIIGGVMIPLSYAPYSASYAAPFDLTLFLESKLNSKTLASHFQRDDFLPFISPLFSHWVLSLFDFSFFGFRSTNVCYC